MSIKNLIKINHKEIKLKIENSPIHSTSNVSQSNDKKQVDAVPQQNIKQENSSIAVHISQQAANLQSININTETGSVVDIERVQQIKQAISDGTFKINSEVVSDRLLETAKELISTK